jgi:SAM-dependent methyltransferase
MTDTIKFDQVADLYDSYVTTELDLQFFLEETSCFKNEILELMCGTGRISIPLLKAGRKLCCVDYSQNMIRIFKKKILNKNFPVRIFEMDVTKLDLKQNFEMIILPFHSFSEILTSDLQLKALISISDHLTRDGIFICTLQNPVVRLKTADGVKRKIGEFRINDSKKMIVSFTNNYNSARKIVTGFQYYDIYDNSDILIEQRKLEINFRPVFDSEFKALIKKLPFEIISQYGDYNKNPFVENKSNFIIYKLKNNFTKA